MPAPNEFNARFRPPWDFCALLGRFRRGCLRDLCLVLRGEF